jgi:thioredoxin reductase
MRKKLRVAIIGAGPAGIAAAIQLTRSGIKPIIFEQYKIGGLLKNAHWIENYPGFPKGISGDSLVRHLYDHIKAWVIKVKMQRVRSLKKSQSRYIIRARRIYYADIVIVATGTEPVTPSIDTEPFSDKVLSEIDTLKKTRGRDIVIIGGGDAAYDYALHLSQNNRILVVNRGPGSRALPLLVNRAQNVNTISIMNNVQLANIGSKDGRLQAILKKSDRKQVVTCDNIVFAIGRTPAMDFISSQLIRKFPQGDRTLYYVGDVKNGMTRQVAIAVGDGVKAAMKIATSLHAKR